MNVFASLGVNETLTKLLKTPGDQDPDAYPDVRDPKRFQGT